MLASVLAGCSSKSSKAVMDDVKDEIVVVRKPAVELIEELSESEETETEVESSESVYIDVDKIDILLNGYAIRFPETADKFSDVDIFAKYDGVEDSYDKEWMLKNLAITGSSVSSAFLLNMNDNGPTELSDYLIAEMDVIVGDDVDLQFLGLTINSRTSYTTVKEELGEPYDYTYSDNISIAMYRFNNGTIEFLIDNTNSKVYDVIFTAVDKEGWVLEQQQ